MEVVEETMGAIDHFPVIKGRRAKRSRPSSTCSLASTSCIEGTSGGGGGGGHEDGHSLGHGNDGSSSSAAMSTNEFIKSTKEEEDLANCLILLAEGRRKNMETGRGEGLYAAYECKTCNRSFPTFQALGGHRASHRKPKAMVNEEKKGLDEGRYNSNNTNSGDQPLVHRADHHHMGGNNNHKSKVHECSICGSEFSSGQALGGHMRRHRNITPASMAMNKGYANDKKSRNVFGLDLNLPAPEEDVVFSPKQQPLIFSAPALVDCHY